MIEHDDPFLDLGNTTYKDALRLRRTMRTPVPSEKPEVLPPHPNTWGPELAREALKLSRSGTPMSDENLRAALHEIVENQR